jgi:heptosyltransferase-2
VVRRVEILIVKIAALGDIAVTTVLLNRIRSEQPSARVTWLTGTSGRDLVELFPGVDDVIVVDDAALFRGSLLRRVGALVRAWNQLLGRRFDRILLLHADARYRLLTLPVFGKMSSLGHGRNPLLSRFRGDEYARLLDGNGSSSGEFGFSDVRPRLSGTATRLGPRVAIVPGGARNILRDDQLRRWPVASYVALANELTRLGIEVVLIGDQGDRRVAAEFAATAAVDLIGKHSLRETLQVLRDVDLIVTHDTGPLHLARLVRTPIVALFGPTPPEHVVGRSDDIEALQAGFEVPCRPCYDGRNYARCFDNVCMKGISVHEVVAAVVRRINVSAPSPR